MKLKHSLWAGLMALVVFNAVGQPRGYRYVRAINGIGSQWHQVNVPDDVFGKAASDLSDIRIIGVTEQNDTLEAPYLLQSTAAQVTAREVAFSIRNRSRSGNTHYVTFEVPSQQPVNEIQLVFDQENFDWRLTLEGSHNQQEWFTIAEDYRILSISNQQTDFEFTTVSFPSATFSFFRVGIESGEKPALQRATLISSEITVGTLRTFPTRTFSVSEDKDNRQTELTVEFPLPVPVSRMAIAVANTFDYYRPVEFQYLADSTKTEQGWQYHYRAVGNGILNSVSGNVFDISTIVARKFRLLVENAENQPLTINAVTAQGYSYSLAARFTEPARYFLTYGNPQVVAPRYDIEQFADKIPADITAVTLGDERYIDPVVASGRAPLFENMWWLWGAMLAVIALLGWFTLKMMKRQ